MTFLTILFIIVICAAWLAESNYKSRKIKNLESEIEFLEKRNELLRNNLFQSFQRNRDC